MTACSSDHLKIIISSYLNHQVSTFRVKNLIIEKGLNHLEKARVKIESR